MVRVSSKRRTCCPSNSGARRRRAGSGRPCEGEKVPPRARLHVNHDVDLDELDPRGRARRRAERAANPSAGRRKRRRVIKVTAWCASGVVLAAAATGFYLVHHLFSRVDTVSLERLTHRPSTARPNASGETPLNLLVLGSQTRDGQHGPHLGN